MLVFMVVSMLSHVRELLARRSRGCEDEDKSSSHDGDEGRREEVSP